MTANPDTRRSLAHHIARIPRWQKTLLILAIALVIVGVAGQAAGLIKPQHLPTAQTNSRGFVEGQPNNEPAPAPEKPWYQKLSPHAMGVGLSILVGFVIGWAIRAFMKITATIAAELAEVVFGGDHYRILFLLGAMLFVVTFLTNIVGDIVVHRLKGQLEGRG